MLNVSPWHASNYDRHTKTHTQGRQLGYVASMGNLEVYGKCPLTVQAYVLNYHVEHGDPEWPVLRLVSKEAEE